MSIELYFFNKLKILAATFFVLPDAMSRATKDFIDGNVCRSFNHPDAIISSANVRLGDLYIVGVADMNSIGVGACCRGNNMDVTHPNVLALSDCNVKTLAVQGSESHQDSI